MKNLKACCQAYWPLVVLALLAGALFASVCKTPEPEVASQEALASEIKDPEFYEAKAVGLSDEDSVKYVLFCRRTTEQYMVNANELGEPRYPHCVYPPLPPEIWATRGKPVPAEVVFLTEDEQERREAARLDKIFDQQAKYNGPVGNTP